MHAVSSYKGPPVGILMLDHALTRPPGDPGNQATFSFPVIHRTVRGVSLKRLLDRDPEILNPLVEAAEALLRQGAGAISSGCGFFIYFQRELSQHLSVPVMLSSLLQIPTVQQFLGPDQRIGVLTAHSERLTREHLLKAGMKPSKPVKVLGLQDEPFFHQAVLVENGTLHADKVQAEVVAKARELIQPDATGARVGAVIFECTNLPPYAAAVQAAVKLPVFDITTMIESLYAALARRKFEPGRNLP